MEHDKQVSRKAKELCTVYQINAQSVINQPSLNKAAKPSEKNENNEQANTVISINNCELVYLPKIEDPRGNLTFVESDRHIPFPIKRVHYLYDVPGGAKRNGHAHKRLKQFLIAMSGSFDVLLDDGKNRELVHLNRSYFGLLIGPMVWREIDNFSSNSMCMVLASERYDEDDYYRNYSEFMVAAHS